MSTCMTVICWFCLVGSVGVALLLALGLGLAAHHGDEMIRRATRERKDQP